MYFTWVGFRRLELDVRYVSSQFHHLSFIYDHESKKYICVKYNYLWVEVFLLDKDGVDEVFEGLFGVHGLGWDKLALRGDKAGVPVSNVAISGRHQDLLPVQLQPAAGAAELLGRILAAVFLDGQHRVRNNLLRVNFGWQGGQKLVLGRDAQCDDGEVDGRRRLLRHWLGWDEPVLAVGVNVLGSNQQWGHAAPVGDLIAGVDGVPRLDGDDGVGAIGLESRWLFRGRSDCEGVFPLDGKDGTDGLVGPDVGRGCAPERDWVLGHGPVGRVPSLHFPARHIYKEKEP